MKLLHAGFDTIEVSFKGSTSFKTLEVLACAKFQAQKENAAQTLEINGLTVQIGKTGTSGGFAYIISTGPEGAIYSLKSSARDDWNLHVKMSSALLLQKGYSGAKQHIYKEIELLKFKVLEESISRIDFAMDLIHENPDFWPDPLRLVAHHRTVTHVNDREVKSGEAWNSRKCHSIRCGQMPNRQLVIYNKTREIKSSNKEYMYKIWGHVDKIDTVWRLELRLGGKYLKEKLGIKRWNEVEHFAPTAFCKLLEKVRLIHPESGVKNVKEAPVDPLWPAALKVLRERFSEFLNKEHAICVRDFKLEEKQGVYEKQVYGLLVGEACLRGFEAEEFERYLQDKFEELQMAIMLDKERLNRTFNRAAHKHGLLVT